MDSKYMTTEQTVAHWGPEFETLSKNPRVHFTDSEIVIDLSRPVVTDEGQVSQLRIKEPLGADMMASDEGGAGNMARTMHLIKSCSGVPLISLKNMKAKDVILASEVANAFL